MNKNEVKKEIKEIVNMLDDVQTMMDILSVSLDNEPKFKALNKILIEEANRLTNLIDTLEYAAEELEIK